MAETPSARRRKGRIAFIPYEKPEDHCPYDPKSWGYDFKLRDFTDGWKEEEKTWEAELKEKLSKFCEKCGQKIEG